MANPKRVTIFEDTDSNLAGFELRIRLTVYKLKSGKIVLAIFKTGERSRVLGRYTNGADLWEDAVSILLEEGYDGSWLDMERTAATLRRMNREFAWQFVTAPNLTDVRQRQHADRLARLLLTNNSLVVRETEQWISLFRQPFQHDLRVFLEQYIEKHNTLPQGIVRVAWDFLVDFDVLRRRLFECDSIEDT